MKIVIELEPRDIALAALALREVAPRFPEGTTALCYKLSDYMQDEKNWKEVIDVR